MSHCDVIERIHIVVCGIDGRPCAFADDELPASPFTLEQAQAVCEKVNSANHTCGPHKIARYTFSGFVK